VIRLCGADFLLFVQNTLMQVAHDHAGQSFVVNKETLADRVRVLFGQFERLL
jgi:hypothetical protein